MEWVADAVAEGFLSASAGSALDKLAKTMISARRARHNETELEEARQILGRMEELERAAQERETRARMGMGSSRVQ